VWLLQTWLLLGRLLLWLLLRLESVSLLRMLQEQPVVLLLLLAVLAMLLLLLVLLLLLLSQRVRFRLFLVQFDHNFANVCEMRIWVHVFRVEQIARSSGRRLAHNLLGRGRSRQDKDDPAETH